ncbi:uncharacterized protein LDX57_007410 [Aspergillus melleus]|uniref:uncharacterized protein n=1 Tax=Aspergillus melleus TaxID=138277 RepID=UPI001E8DA597|nr:uncharacterized protein LDX57_007410 [Aspergillus melleus]KAH8429738.1 hypothetical protein LDX57_007410 [Aspergillus melleus]
MMSQFHEAIGIERQGRREADGHIAEKEEENKELRERISELEHELETSESRRDTISENLRERTEASNRLEQELDLCKKEKQSALDQQSQSQEMLKQLKAELDEAQKRNNDLQMEAKIREDEIRVLSEQLKDETKTNTQLQNMATEMQKACESAEAEKRDLREQLNTANREKSDLDIEMARARERSEAGMQKLRDQLSAANNKKDELEEKANAMRNERDEGETMRQNAAEERRAAETKNRHLHTQLSLSNETITKLENDIATKQREYNRIEQKFERYRTEDLSMIQSRDDGMSENEYNQAQEHTDNIEAEISTLKSENEALSKEKQDLTARNIFLQRKVLRVSVRLRTTQRLLTSERANSMKSRKQKKFLCAALDKSKEEQTRLTIANRDLEALIPTLQNDIEDLKDCQDSPGATARPNNPRTRERKRNRQVGQVREGGRIYM